MTTKEYMRTATAVEGEWCAELGPMFFSVKESYKDRLAKRLLEKSDKKTMEDEMDEAFKRAEARAKEKKDAAHREFEASRSRQKFSTPGLGKKGAASRTPMRLGL